MGLTSFSIRKPLAMVMVILAMVLFGLVSFSRLPVDMMPEMDLPFVAVQTIYMGAGPEEVENSVVKPIEEQMTTISGIKNVTSYCMEGGGFIVCEFDLGIEVDIAAIEVKDKIDKILYTLPGDLMKPIVDKFDPNDQPIMTLALTGPTSSEKLRLIADHEISEQLVKIPGVANISLKGGREREIQVNLRREKLDAYNLSVAQVFPVILSQSVNFPSGYVTGNRREYTVRVQGEFESIAEIADLRIPTMSGGSVRLSEIADVEDAFKDVRDRARLNGKDAVNLSILKRPDANIVRVASQIRREVDKIKSRLPRGFDLTVAEDHTQFIKDAVNDTYSSMALGVVLTALILLVFLFDWKLMLIAAITMPASVVMAFTGMAALGFTLNIVTLMSLSISVGILVTNSIIVLENIVRKRNEGMRVREAALVGTGEIMVAVMASTLTNLAVFIPIATTGGITGSVFRSLGLTIVFATVASLFLSFTLTPLMASRMLRDRDVTVEERVNAMDSVMGRLVVWYRMVLTRAAGSRRIKASSIALVVVLVVVSLRLARSIGSEFMPNADQGYIAVSVEMPPGTPLHVTDRVMSTVESRLGEFDEIETATSTIGGSGANTGVYYGQVMAKLVPGNKRDKTSDQLAAELRPLLAGLPDANVFVSPMQMMGGPSEFDMTVEVTGADMDRILAYADSVTKCMESMHGLADINLSYKGVIPEIKIIPDRDRMDHYGMMTVASLGGIMRFNMTGNDDGVFREDNEDYPIRVQMAVEDRNTIDEVERLNVPTAHGFVPVTALSRIEYGDGPSSINRKNRTRMVSVHANVSEGSSGKKVAELKEMTADVPLEEGYGIGFGGFQEMMAESNIQLVVAGLLAVALTYMVLVGLLESLVMALVIWLTLPLGLIGVIWALLLTGRTFNMLSNMSIIMLIGIVVNNAILLIDHARQVRRERGLSAADAIVEAAGVKLKAIIMMNLAIVFAMLPQALALGSGGEMRAPFAITAIGGIIVSTVLTLFVTPLLYVITAPKKAPGKREQ